MPKNNNTTDARPTKLELERRLDIVESLLIDCATVGDICRYFAEQEKIPLARRTIERYREHADRRIGKIMAPQREQEIRYAKLRLERCFARAISGSKKNVPAAIAAQKAIVELLGLNAPKDEQDEMTPREFAELVAQQSKEMQRITVGTEGLKDEMTVLIERYREMGADPVELLQEFIQRHTEPPLEYRPDSHEA